MAKLRVACVGAGYFSRFQYEAWARMPDVALVAACNRSPDPVRAVASIYAIPATYDDVAEMLDRERPDLLDIITPPETHLAYVQEAARRRIPAICQKAFCRTLAEAETATAAAEAAGSLLVVHENFRFQPWHQEASRILAAGGIGEPYQVSFRLRPGDGQGPRAYLDRQPYFQQMERFLVHETAIHLIDTFRFLLGEVTGVFARLKRLNPAIKGEDAGLILFDFRSGARGLFDGNRLVDHATDNCRRTMGEMLVEGSEAVLRLDGRGRLLRRARGSAQEEEIAYSWEDRGFGGDCVYRLQRHVVDHLRGHGPAMNRAGDYLANLRVEQAVYDSDRSGRWIAL